MTIKCLVVNAYGPNNTPFKFTRWVKSLDPDYIFLNEAKNVISILNKTGYHIAVGSGSRGALDTAIATRRNFDDFTSDKVTPNLDRPIAPARHVCNVKRNKKSLYSIHANAVIQDRRTGGWRTWRVSDVWKKAMIFKINKMIEEDQEAGDKVFGGGDMNWRRKLKHRRTDVPGSPEWLCQQRDLKFFTTELMWFFWDSEYFNLVEAKIIPGQEVPTGTNDKHPHDALWVELYPV